MMGLIPHYSNPQYIDNSRELLLAYIGLQNMYDFHFAVRSLHHEYAQSNFSTHINDGFSIHDSSPERVGRGGGPGQNVS